MTTNHTELLDTLIAELTTIRGAGDPWTKGWAKTVLWISKTRPIMMAYWPQYEDLFQNASVEPLFAHPLTAAQANMTVRMVKKQNNQRHAENNRKLLYTIDQLLNFMNGLCLSAAIPVTQNHNQTDHYIAPERLNELRIITSANFDLNRLIRLCEELDISMINQCYFAAGALTRSILDHVPPIFGANKFADIANNYAGTKSFKDSMQHLNGSLRKISDAVMHSQIRDSEVLPTRQQVNVQNDLDVLLGEIVRILKQS